MPFVVEVRTTAAPRAGPTHASDAPRCRTGWGSSTQSRRRLPRRWRPGLAPRLRSWQRWPPRPRRWAARTQPFASRATWPICAPSRLERRAEGGTGTGSRCQGLNGECYSKRDQTMPIYSVRGGVTCLAACAAAAPPLRVQPRPAFQHPDAALARLPQRTWRLAAPSCASSPPPPAPQPARCACTRPPPWRRRPPGAPRVAAPWLPAAKAWPGTPFGALGKLAGWGCARAVSGGQGRARAGRWCGR